MNQKRAREYTSTIIAYLSVDPTRISKDQRKLVTFTIQLIALEGERASSRRIARIGMSRRRKERSK